MASQFIFISHTTTDDEFARELREALEAQGLRVWTDSRNLRGGMKLNPEIERAIEQARQVLVVLSPETQNSPWVRKEIRKAEAVEKVRRKEGYCVVPILLPGVQPSALGLYFEDEPMAVPVQAGLGGVSVSMPRILAALGERLPTAERPMESAQPKPFEELILRLTDPMIQTRKGKVRGLATATLTYVPADPEVRKVESDRFTFTAPLGPIEAEDLRWYLESYYFWPTGLFKDRADRIVDNLPKWGEALYKAALGKRVAQESLQAWRHTIEGAEGCFSIWVDSRVPEGVSKRKKDAVAEAASELLSLPWELLHDGRGYLFHGRNAVRVRRRMRNRHAQGRTAAQIPIRILLVSPRPEDDHAAYIDHRSSALPLVQAVEGLGELVDLTVLTPPTFVAMEEALKRGDDANQPYDVVHFDGHGVYDRRLGLGALCFEDPKDAEKLAGRTTDLRQAKELAGVIRGYRIPLVFLDACQTAKAEQDPTASVAAKLLEEGVTSVVAMSHTVLVETARRFVAAFYGELARGTRVGQAMLAGQRALAGDTYRGKIMGAGDLRLQDWFVPVLYQEERDLQLFTERHSEEIQRLADKRRQLCLGMLPPAPDHSFIGRSRELLGLERLLHTGSYAVVRGPGGSGKTTLAIELARWLAYTNRFARVAFVSLESISDVRAVLDALGRQLLPDGDGYSVAQFRSRKKALQPVERALAEQPTLIVLDNMESVLADAAGVAPPEAAPVDELFDLCRSLLDADKATRLLFTTREPLSEPFAHRGREVFLGALSRDDAVELVGRVMAREGLEPEPQDSGSTPQEITDLVEAVHCHARALVLLAREVSRQGVRATTENLHRLMADLAKRHPDDREQSLYASVQLSLNRLPKEMREHIKVLGVCQGGGHLPVLAHVMDVDQETASGIGASLIGVGLAENMGHGHLRFDPALAPHLLNQLTTEDRERAAERWGEKMVQFTGYLYDQHFKDARLAARLALLELPNLLQMLRWAQETMPPELVVELADSVESLIAPRGRPGALAQIAEVRKQVAAKLGEWGHAQYLVQASRIDRLIDRGEFQSALEAAGRLVESCAAAGEDAYESAGYDLALSHFRFGRALWRGGKAQEALAPLAEAERRFRALTEAGVPEAERMASVVVTERGDCFRHLGRLDDAAAAYEEVIKLDEKAGRMRDLAVDKMQLGTIRVLQRLFPQALEAYSEAREMFESLGAPLSVARVLHQMGVLYTEMQQFAPAEDAYRKSLAIKVQEKDRSGEATTLAQLGVLSGRMDRLEEAVKFYRQAVDIYVELDDPAKEGQVRNNLAIDLASLKRFDEARREIRRALECDKAFGHTVEPWKTWLVLSKLERQAGDPEAAAAARQKGIEYYLAYRRAGGESQSPGVKLCALMGAAIVQEKTAEAEQFLSRLLRESREEWVQTMVPKLQAILNGDRDRALADDPELDYDDAVELKLLLETLTK